MSNTNDAYLLHPTRLHARFRLSAAEFGYNFLQSCKKQHKNRTKSPLSRFRKAFFICYSAVAMDYLWTPWRYAYVTTAEKATGCIFCDLPKAGDDEKVRITYRGQHCYVILNAFPYTPGHVMIVPLRASG